VRARHEQGLATETEVMMAAALADQAKAAYTESLADFEIAKARLVLLCSKGSVSTDL
jgi:outer membrane protein TolC